MGFFSGIGSLFSSAISSVCSVLGSIGPTVMKISTTIAPYLNTIMSVISTIAQVIGLITKEDKAEVIGAAMRQAEKKPDDFDKISDYIAYLRGEVKDGKIDLEVDNTQKEIDKALGASLFIKGIEEKYGFSTSTEFWGSIGKKVSEKKLDTDDVGAMLKTASGEKVSLDELANYINNKEMSTKSKNEVSSVIESALKEAKPELSQNELIAKFNELLKK